jgi:hypothetical protein
MQGIPMHSGPIVGTSNSRQFGLLDRIGNCLIQLGNANDEYCHVEFSEYPELI